MNPKIQGFLYGLLSSAAFGLIPLFAIPAMNEGLDFLSVLFYRFLIATSCLALLLRLKGETFSVSRNDMPVLLLLGVFYLISSLFLIWGYKLMSSGIATTIHFMYPVLTTLIMMLFFREKKSLWRILAILLAVSGVYLLSCGDTHSGLTLVNILIVLLSALGYALYLVTIGVRKNKDLKGMRLTFYVFLLGTLMLFVGMLCFHPIQPIPNWTTAGNLFLLAVIPTIIANLTLVEGIKRIGSTVTSLLGAMEPVTALMVGILVFGDHLTATSLAGIAVILSAVMMIMIKKS